MPDVLHRPRSRLHRNKYARSSRLGALPALVRRASFGRPVLAVPQSRTYPASVLASPPRPGHNQKEGSPPNAVHRHRTQYRQPTGCISSGCPDGGRGDQGA